MLQPIQNRRSFRFWGQPWYKEPIYLGTASIFLLLFSLMVYTIYVDSHATPLRYEEGFKGEVDDIFNQKSTLYIHVFNRDQWIRLENFRNNFYPDLGFNFMDIVKEGDLLYKLENTDSIHLERNQHKYSFKLEKLNLEPY